MGDRDPFRLLDLEHLKTYVKAIKKNINPRKGVFYLHGGETFLASISYLREACEIIRSEFKFPDFLIVPQTNLLCKITDETLKFLLDYCHNQVGVSWDADIRFATTTQEETFFKNLRFLIDNHRSAYISITQQVHLLKRDPIELARKFDGANAIDFELLSPFSPEVKKLKVNNEEWSNWYLKLVEYYLANNTGWSLPTVDLFVKSIMDGEVHDCKCRCCDRRTLTLNTNGTVGLCPDTAYFDPVTDVSRLNDEHWDTFTKLSQSQILRRFDTTEPSCYTCDHFDVCGGHCEKELFDESDECPMSKKVIQFVKDHVDEFEHLFETRAKFNHAELERERLCNPNTPNKVPLKK